MPLLLERSKEELEALVLCEACVALATPMEMELAGPQVPLSSVPEGEVHHQSVARQVFPEATPTVNVSVSEAKAAEDNPAASANDEQEEERVPTPPITEEVVPKVNMPVPDPPSHQVEGRALTCSPREQLLQ